MALPFPKKPYRTHGGVAVPHHKNTAALPTREMPPPKRVVIPMQQHIGAACEPLVKRGDHVLLGQCIGDSDAPLATPIHASVSGDVAEVGQVFISGSEPAVAVVIESDGKMERDPGNVPPAPVHDRFQLAAAARAAGLVGLGGAGFPVHAKLSVAPDKTVDTLIVNAAECEPYVTSDHREALENGKNVLDGIYKVKEILGVHRVIIAVEDNKPDAIRELSRIADNPALDPNDEVRVLTLKSRYPQGAEKVLIQACTGRKVPVGGLPVDVNCLVMNIASISFLASYLRTGFPLTLKRVTVDGPAVAHPQNVIVPIGTPIRDVMEFCGGYKAPAKKLLMGGPMMGIALYTDELPILKQNNAVLAFDDRAAAEPAPTDCIRCGSCVAACPMNLMPLKLEKAALRRDAAALKALDVLTCMECGSCAYACPAGRQLVQAIRLGKALVHNAGR